VRASRRNSRQLQPARREAAKHFSMCALSLHLLDYQQSASRVLAAPLPGGCTQLQHKSTHVCVAGKGGAGDPAPGLQRLRGSGVAMAEGGRALQVLQAHRTAGQPFALATAGAHSRPASKITKK
jgi:hypothetical protein